MESHWKSCGVAKNKVNDGIGASQSEKSKAQANIPRALYQGEANQSREKAVVGGLGVQCLGVRVSQLNFPLRPREN